MVFATVESVNTIIDAHTIVDKNIGARDIEINIVKDDYTIRKAITNFTDNCVDLIGCGGGQRDACIRNKIMSLTCVMRFASGNSGQYMRHRQFVVGN